MNRLREIVAVIVGAEQGSGEEVGTGRGTRIRIAQEADEESAVPADTSIGWSR